MISIFMRIIEELYNVIIEKVRSLNYLIESNVMLKYYD